MLRCQHGGNQNDAIHIILAEGSEIGQLLIGIIFRIGKQKLIACFIELTADTGDNARNRFGINLGDHDSDDFCTFCPQRLCLFRWGIPCLRDHAADRFFFFLADISLIQIA